MTTTLPPRIRALRRGAALLSACAALGAAAAPATAADRTPTARLSLPAPTGPYPVGVRSASVSDPTRIDPATGRPRRLPLRVWYPARDGSAGPPARYLTPFAEALLEGAVGAPPGLFDVDTHAIEGAPARHGLRGVLLVQPGGGSLAALQTGQIVELASRGYAVVASDHPHDASVIEEPDGPIFEDPNSVDIPLAVRVRDGVVILDALHRIVPEMGPQTPIGMFGHSRGAAATPELMLRDARISAGVGLDIATVLFFGGPDSPPGDVVSAGLDRPFAFMCSLIQPCDLPYLADFAARLRGPHRSLQQAVEHTGFTDFVVFNGQAARFDRTLGEALEALAPTGTLDDPGAGRRALAAQRRFLVRFFDHQLARG
jgi:hypothetical protein